MRIQYVSDLHLEFPLNKAYLRLNPLSEGADILLLAGDIVPFNSMDIHEDFFDMVSNYYPITYWVPGNHEYYYYDAATKSGKLNERIRDNLFLINNMAVQHENVKLIFSTMWSKISLMNKWQIQKGMNDFYVIKYNGEYFSSESYNCLHEESIAFIKEELNKNNSEKTIVATHHVPTLLNYPKKYRNSVLTEGFAVELFDLIEPSGVDYWIYGHHHTNIPEFKIGKTSMVTNQLGYVQNTEHLLFNKERIIEI